MPRKPSSTLTEVELQILNVLWSNGPGSVGRIHSALKGRRNTGYSSTLKMVQVMTEKGLLVKDDTCRPQIFTPAMTQEQAQAGLVDALIQSAFGGAVDTLVLRALESKHVSPEELRRIKKMIAQVKGTEL